MHISSEYSHELHTHTFFKDNKLSSSFCSTLFLIPSIYSTFDNLIHIYIYIFLLKIKLR